MLQIIPQASATTLFSDGYEGGFSGWTATEDSGGEPTIVDEWSVEGAYSMLLEGTDTHSYSAKIGLISQQIFYLQTTIYQPILLEAGNNLMSILTARSVNGQIFELYLYRSKFVLFYRVELDPYISVESNLISFQPNASTVIEVGTKIENTIGEYHVYVDGVEVITILNVNNDDVGGVNYFYVGHTYMQGIGVDTYFDRVKASTSYIGFSNPTPTPTSSPPIPNELDEWLANFTARNPDVGAFLGEDISYWRATR